MQEPISAEENIDRLLTHFQQQGQNDDIRRWRQSIEDKKARSTRRSPCTINTEQAVKDFRHALLTDAELSESAKNLLRELNRPAKPKFTAVEAWRLQNHANRPAFLTPEQQAYIKRYDQQERDRKKWDLPIPQERLQKWDELDEQGRRKEVRADQAMLFEEWLQQHPKLTEELLIRFTRPGAPPNALLEDTEHSETDLPKSYHWSGLYWLAANVLMKMYGLDDRVAEPIIQRLRAKWNQPRYDADAVTMGCASGYMAVIQQLAKDGAHNITKIDHYLFRTVRNAILQESGYDRHKNQKQSVTCPCCGGSEIIPPAVCPNCNSGVPEQPVISQHQECPIDDLRREESPRASQTDSPDSEVGFAQLIRSLPDHLQQYVVFLIMNPDATTVEAADALGCDPRTIERRRKALREIITP